MKGFSPNVTLFYLVASMPGILAWNFGATRCCPKYRSTYEFPSRMSEFPLLLMSGDASEDDADEASEDSGDSEDWDMAWQRYRLEGIESGWWQSFRLEALEGLPRTSYTPRLDEKFGIPVAIAAFLLMLKAYLVHAGGIVIVPEDGGLMTIFNFHELQEIGNKEPSKLLKLGLPMPVPAPQPVVPPMRPLLRLLLSDFTDVLPPA
mmetsp:Transcript_13530/g.22492  ORF Transcript_13530/g.22492 Transcript_13530/m.22492 type:complete len:205 (+) Transcript_13530:15-629(+)|eukprot:CAMPEP_0119308682 /NCGR_PEP_ID=MMETSP1333-20130426/12038_1 /TAXON_ID=418940 /ORGANISM="Scyphosphaera apsteinii, Strain RCC1455" /LENGTH=204 /DNA_ID=CAMNT_0007312513 /DNA_START=12 /DNA_END=626 /DNA_ORIENTATION=-